MSFYLMKLTARILRSIFTLRQKKGNKFALKLGDFPFVEADRLL